jgi:hypothetical protein
MDPSLSVDARQPDSHRQLQLQGLRKNGKLKTNKQNQGKGKEKTTPKKLEMDKLLQSLIPI